MKMKETSRVIDKKLSVNNNLNQLPFSSINYGTCTLTEGRMVTDALLDVSIEGLGKHHITSIFPCGIFQYKKGVNDEPGTPNYDLFRKALKSTSLRIYPNYANCNCSQQESWLKQDRETRQAYLVSLSDEDMTKLVEQLESHPDIMKKLELYIEDKKVKVVQEEQPIELFATMGK